MYTPAWQRKRNVIITNLQGKQLNRKDFPRFLHILNFKCVQTLSKLNSKHVKEGNVLFNNALNTFYLLLYGVGHMVKYHSDSERKPAAATWSTLFD